MRQTCILFIVATASYVISQKNEGDSCVDSYTNVVGRCTPAEQCQSAMEDNKSNGVLPTFCEFDAFGESLVCCKDGTTIVKDIASKDSQPRPQSQSPSPRKTEDSSAAKDGNASGVSERKCEEYSQLVVQKVDYSSLLLNANTRTISGAKCDYSGIQLIVGGDEASRGEFPHMAAIGWAVFPSGYSFLCGGSLISPRFVLTAGHCIYLNSTQLLNPAPIIVRLGDQNLDENVDDGADAFDVPISKIYPHPDYEPPITYDDIALLELARDVQFTAAVRPACLWTDSGFASYTDVVATGWGVTAADSTRTSKELKKVTLPLLENAYCDGLLLKIRNRYWEGFRATQMCAGVVTGGMDTCQGDSGAPLQVTSNDNQCIFRLIGVTSFGKSCAKSGRPGVYTRVSSYVTWIESVVWPGG